MSSAARSSAPAPISTRVRTLCGAALPAGAAARRRDRSAARRPKCSPPQRPDQAPARRSRAATAELGAQRPRDSDEFLDAERLGAARRDRCRAARSASSAPGSAFKRAAQHLAALAEGGGGEPLERRGADARRAASPGTMWTTADITLGGGTKAERWTFIASLGLAAPLGEDGEAAIGAGAGPGDDPLGDLAAGTSGSATSTRAARPRRRASGPAGRCRHCRAGWRRYGPGPISLGSSIASASPSITRSRPSAASASSASGGEAAPVALDRDDLGAGAEQGAGQPAGARADLVDALAVERPGHSRDPVEQLLVEQEILAERLRRAEAVARDHLAQRRQRRPRRSRRGEPARAFAGGADRGDHRARIGACRWPAMSKAVPWSGEVRTIGRPSVTLTPSSKCSVFSGISAWS